jgi:hypothetical protein
MIKKLLLASLAGLVLAAPAARAADAMDPQLREKARRSVDAGLNYLRSLVGADTGAGGIIWVNLSSGAAAPAQPAVPAPAPAAPVGTGTSIRLDLAPPP